MNRARPYEIAIVGMGCSFPGTPDLSSFFEKTLSAKECTPDNAPPSRGADVSLAPQSRADDRVSAHRRGYGESPIRLNAAEPKTMARTLRCIEPDILVALDATASALADAGLGPDSFKRLNGASFVVNAAEGSSMVAVRHAARSLIKKRTDLAIAGGVALSADADATTSAESAGIIVLKRRADAERAGDRIYALIQGVGLVGDGIGSAAPSARSYARAMRRAYHRTGIDLATVALVEGHGLDMTAAGRAELRALNAVFPPLPRGRRTLSGNPSMAGDVMTAAGIAGLIKSALALYHRVLPPTPRAEKPRRLLAGRASTFALDPVARPWIHGDEQTPRRAAANAFGFAGFNTHVVLEEHTPSADADPVGALRTWDTEAILLSGADRAELITHVKEVLNWLKGDSQHTLLDVAYSLNVRRQHFPTEARLGIVASSIAELVDRLGAVVPRLEDPACRSIRDGRGIYFWAEPLLKDGRPGLAFLFPGEGSQYPGMLADLCLHFPEVRILFDTADRIARDLGETVLPSEHLFGPVAAADEKLWSTATAVNVVLNAQWALYQVLTRLGLQPDAVLGHSSGEILALSAGGVFETDRVLERKLGRLGAIMRGLESSGDLPAARLVAIATHRDRVESICRDPHAGDMAIAIDNCPHQVVVAVPSAQLAQVLERLRRENILFEELPFSRAYHTPGFRPVVGPIAEFFEQMNFRLPRVPIYSCASRGRMPHSQEAIRQLAVAQWTQTVAFRETIETMHADGLRLFVDVGARGNLAGFVEDTLRGKPSFAIAANLPRRSGLTQLNHLVAATFAHGASLNAAYLYARRRPRAIDWNDSEPTLPIGVERKNDFPEMKLADRDLTVPLVADPAPSVWSPHDPNGEEHAEPTLMDASQDDLAMLSFQDTMQAFLRTQKAVMTAYLGDSITDDSFWKSQSHDSPFTEISGVSGVEPGAWTGEISRIVPGVEVETRLILEVHDDPVARHHTLGGRRISSVNPLLLGLPVLPFAVMAEMTAQVASLIVRPGLILTGLKGVRAHKWVRYQEEPVILELRGQRVSSQAGDRVWVGIFNRGTDGRAEPSRPVFEAIAIFGAALPDPIPTAAWTLENARPSKFTARSVYDEQWLFHGPLFQAIAHIGKLSDKGIEGRLRVLPLEPLVKKGQATTFHTDLVVIDNFTQLLGAWGLDYLAEGDVMFPLHMEELEIHGARPPVDSEVACQIKITKLERYRISVEAQFVRPDGTVWMRIKDWEDWRFHWPGRYRDSFRQPRDYLVGEELSLQLPNEGACTAAKAVWLEPPADMGRPVWRDVLEFTQLGPDERADFDSTVTVSEEERSQWLWGRIAAKEAARRLWNDAGQPGVYPADLRIVADEPGGPRLTRVGDLSVDALPSIAIAHADGVAIALAVLDPTARVGIDVKPIGDQSSPVDITAFSAGERKILSRWSGPALAEWAARFSCAKQAAARASGLSSLSEATRFRVIEAGADTGLIEVQLADELVKTSSDGYCDRTFIVGSARRAGRAWAWTIAKTTGGWKYTQSRVTVGRIGNPSHGEFPSAGRPKESNHDFRPFPK